MPATASSLRAATRRQAPATLPPPAAPPAQQLEKRDGQKRAPGDFGVRQLQPLLHDRHVVIEQQIQIDGRGAFLSSPRTRPKSCSMPRSSTNFNVRGGARAHDRHPVDERRLLGPPDGRRAVESGQAGQFHARPAGPAPGEYSLPRRDSPQDRCTRAPGADRLYRQTVRARKFPRPRCAQNAARWVLPPSRARAARAISEAQRGDALRQRFHQVKGR